MPSPSGGSSISDSSKSSRVGVPLGRLFRCQARAMRPSFLVFAHRPRRRCEKDPAVKGTAPPGLVEPPAAEAQLATALAIGALEASIEHAGAHFAAVLALEQRAAAAFVAPPLARLLGRAVEDHAVAFHPIDVRAAERILRSAAVRVRLGQDDPIAGDAGDRAGLLIVLAD